MTLTQEIFILTLSLLPGIGRKTVMRVLGQYTETPATDVEILEIVQNHGGRRGEKITIGDVTPALDRAHQLISDSAEKGIIAVAVTDPAYPDELKNIDDSPVLLYVKGDPSALKPKNSVAIIGTRHPTDYAAKSAYRIATRLTEEGRIIVSGLALGCDTQGHKGCVDAAGVSVAALAHGLDQVHPKSNADLAERILEHGGALVSEYFLGEKPQPVYFVERDRVQSGLSSAVLVIETDVDGGTMHTVRFAKKHSRQLAVLAHPERFSNDPKSAGNRELLAEKSVLAISESEDLGILLAKLNKTDTPQLEVPPENPAAVVQRELFGDER